MSEQTTENNCMHMSRFQLLKQHLEEKAASDQHNRKHNLGKGFHATPNLIWLPGNRYN